VRIFKEKIPASGRTEYQNFSTAVNSHLGQFIVLTKGSAGAKIVISESDPRAEELIGKAAEAIQRRDFNGARDALSQAELLNPKQRGLWLAWSMLYGVTEQRVKAIESLHKEIDLHPGEPEMYRGLAKMENYYGHRSEAAAALRQLLKIAPDDVDASKELAGNLIGQKEFDEAVSTLERARKAAPDDLNLETLRIQALLQSGRKQDGIAAARAIGSRSPDAGELNSVAYELAETGADLKLAREYADRSVTMLEEGLKDVKLSGLRQEQLSDVYTLAMVWDTAGWANFLAGDLAKAEKSVEASWKLCENGIVADHLAQIYEKQGKKEEAVHLWRLSLATGDQSEGVSERLQKIEGPRAWKNGNTTTVLVGNTPAPAEELGKLRTVAIAGFSRPKGTAEYFVLLSAKGVEDVMFLSGADELSGAKEAIIKAKFDTPFADNGPEKIARRGILSCSALTKPNCQLVLMLPSNTTAP
jgi:tetratricopeptide (TPR) repeat protein